MNCSFEWLLNELERVPYQKAAPIFVVSFSLTSAPPPAPLWTSSFPSGGFAPFQGRTSRSCLHSIPPNLMKQNKTLISDLQQYFDKIYIKYLTG